MPAVISERWSDRRFIRGAQAVRSWDVIGATDDNDAIQATGVAENDTYAQDSRLKVRNGGIEVRNVGPNMLRVTTTYTAPGSTSGGGTIDPLSEPPRIHPEIVQTTEKVDVDVYGNAIANSAGVPFAGGVDFENSLLRLTYTRNESAFDVALAIQYTNKLNSDEIVVNRFGTVLPGQMLCRSIGVEAYQTGPTLPLYVTASYVFDIRPDHKTFTNIGRVSGWRRRILDQGRQGLYVAENFLRVGRIVDGDNKSVSDDVNLNGHGYPMPGAIDGADYFVQSTTATPGSGTLPGIADGSIKIEPAIVGGRVVGYWLYYLLHQEAPFLALGL